MGPAQVAECAVFAELDDWRFDEERRRVELIAEEGSVSEVRVETERGTWTVSVEAGRAVPTIACGEPGGLPAKPGAEWTVTGIRRH